jgi:riboflavin transporter FmnP
MTSATPPASTQPTSIPVLRRILIYGAWVAVAIAVVGSVIGYLVDGGTGVLSALIGTVMSVAFMGITAGSILLANRVAGNESAMGGFFGIIMGGWLLKFIVFLVLLVVLQDREWIQPMVLFFCIVAGVVGSLVVDTVVVMTSRMSYVSDVRLPPAPVDE